MNNINFKITFFVESFEKLKELLKKYSHLQLRKYHYADGGIVVTLEEF